MDKSKKVRTQSPRRKSEARDTDPIPRQELIELAKSSDALKWLRDPDQDIYSLKDGKSASWSTKQKG